MNSWMEQMVVREDMITEYETNVGLGAGGGMYDI